MRYPKQTGIFLRLIAIGATIAATIPGSAHACRVRVEPELDDVRYADVVVTGHIENYRVIRDEAFRARMLASSGLDPDMLEMYRDPNTSLLSDYARFEFQVDQVLVGQASNKISVTWNNSTFGEPERMEPGRYLIALRRPASPSPPLRGPSATILPAPDPNALTLLQAPCSDAFIYPVESEQARAIVNALRASQ